MYKCLYIVPASHTKVYQNPELRLLSELSISIWNRSFLAMCCHFYFSIVVLIPRYFLLRQDILPMFPQYYILIKMIFCYNLLCYWTVTVPKSFWITSNHVNWSAFKRNKAFGEVLFIKHLFWIWHYRMLQRNKIRRQFWP